MEEVYILDGLRTPIGKAQGLFKNLSAVDLAVVVLEGLTSKGKISKQSIDEVILGNTVSAGLGQNPARQALLRAGFPGSTPAFTINKVCGSGLKSIILAAQAILCGDADVIIAGGTESASGAPFLLPRGSKSKEDADSEQQGKDSIINDGLWCNISDSHMGMIAENMAEEFNISRQEQDDYALLSHSRAIAAQDKEYFSDEITPVKIGENSFIDKDEKPRQNQDLKILGRLPAAFKKQGTVTAGNASTVADAAAAVIVASKKFIQDNKITPVAAITGYSVVAINPQQTFTASAEAINKCLKRCSWAIEDVDLFDITESFAVQMLYTINKLGLSMDKVNVFGGAIALGHPLAASGTRSLVTLINALKINQLKTGMSATCLGGGAGVSLGIRRS